VQVDPIKPTLKAPGTKYFKLEYDELLSSFALKFNLRGYAVDSDSVLPFAAAHMLPLPSAAAADGGDRHGHGHEPSAMVLVDAAVRRCRMTLSNPR
jgi:hypothetical protein